jgi:hypothetical protein
VDARLIAAIEPKVSAYESLSRNWFFFAPDFVLHPTKLCFWTAQSNNHSVKYISGPPTHSRGRVASLVGGLEDARCAAAFENETIPIEANARAMISTVTPVLKRSPLLPTSIADGRALNPAVCLCALRGR